MSKKLIAIAVAAAFAAPVAMADVVLYGKVHMDVRSTDNNSTISNVTVNSNASRLGFKGSEDLGNGLKALFKYEMTYSGVDSGTAIGGARNSYIGLAGDFGTFVLGRHDTPAKSALYAAGNDHLGDSIIDFTQIGFTENRATNAIAYISPNWSGFKMAAAIVPGEQSGTSVADNAGTPDVNESAENDENSLMDSYSIGLMYKNGGLKAGFGYERMADTGNAQNADNNDVTTTQIGASYTFSNITLGAQYSSDDNYQNTEDQERTTWALAGKYAFGNNAIIANYGNTQTENAAGTTTADTNHAGIAFQHKMSKRTNVYVAFKNEDADNGVDQDELAVGMVHSF